MYNSGLKFHIKKSKGMWRTYRHISARDYQLPVVVDKIFLEAYWKTVKYLYH